LDEEPGRTGSRFFFVEVPAPFHNLDLHEGRVLWRVLRSGCFSCSKRFPSDCSKSGFLVYLKTTLEAVPLRVYYSLFFYMTSPYAFKRSLILRALLPLPLVVPVPCRFASLRAHWLLVVRKTGKHVRRLTTGIREVLCHVFKDSSPLIIVFESGLRANLSGSGPQRSFLPESNFLPCFLMSSLGPLLPDGQVVRLPRYENAAHLPVFLWQTLYGKSESAWIQLSLLFGADPLDPGMSIFSLMRDDGELSALTPPACSPSSK